MTIKTSIITAMVVTASVSGVFAANEESESRPNILWLTIEDTSLLFGCYGDKIADTPNIDRLAEEGTLFTSAFASSPVCSAARSALITGMYVGELGVGNHRSIVDIPSSVRGFPSYLRQAGYYCTNCYKNDFNFATAREFAKDCWDENDKNAHWRGRKDQQPFFSVFNFNDSHQSRTTVNSYERFQRNIQSQLSPGEITQPDDVVLPPFYHDSPRMRKAYARVYDCISVVDRQIGEKLQQLEADGLMDDTIIVFFSDHGQGIPRYKTFPFGLGFRVPMIIRVPEKFQDLVQLTPGTTCENIVSFVDLGPTMLNIAGLPIPESMSGKSVLGSNSVAKQQFYGSLNDIGATENHSRSISDGRYMYIRNYMPHLAYSQSQMYCDSGDMMRWIREDSEAGLLTGAAADFMSSSRPAESLFDLKNDPWEIKDLAANPAYQQTLQEMRVRNRDKILEVRDLHFLHAWEIETRGGGKPAADFRDDESKFPLEKILAIAELSGKGPNVIQQQMEALDDPEPMCRYWAMIGLQSQQEITPSILAAARKALKDSASYVRYEAAFLILNQRSSGPSDELNDLPAYRVLIDGIDELHTIPVSHAMRKISLLSQHAAAFIDEVNQLKKTYRKLPDRRKLFEIGTSIKAVELSYAGKVPQPMDNY